MVFAVLEVEQEITEYFSFDVGIYYYKRFSCIINCIYIFHCLQPFFSCSQLLHIYDHLLCTTNYFYILNEH